LGTANQKKVGNRHLKIVVETKVILHGKNKELLELENGRKKEGCKEGKNRVAINGFGYIYITKSISLKWQYTAVIYI
jgi:hypothetical protein